MEARLSLPAWHNAARHATGPFTGHLRHSSIHIGNAARELDASTICRPIMVQRASATRRARSTGRSCLRTPLMPIIVVAANRRDGPTPR
jgi:hypothetical protein